MNRRACYIGVLFALVVIASALVPVTGYAQEISFARGQVLNHMLSVCLDKKDALAILDADEKDGFAAASVIWEAAPKCSTLPVTGGPTVGRVVKSAKVKRGEKEITAKVVEIVHGGEVIGYFFTTATVDERNS
jgi:hypothetical protein